MMSLSSYNPMISHEAPVLHFQNALTIISMDVQQQSLGILRKTENNLLTRTMSNSPAKPICLS